MEHEITLANGVTAKITEHEAKRIAEHVNSVNGGTTSHHTHYPAAMAGDHSSAVKQNSKYLCNAKRNIMTLLEWDHKPETEEELKAILFKYMPELSEDQADLLYEIIEMAIALHFNKIHNVEFE